MDGSKPGEAGVLTWCNSIRFSVAQDPGRAFLATQIQKQGFDFLESYGETIFSRQREGTVYELLKTPSRKKDASERTRSATAMAAKVQAANAALNEENAVPINDFHRALLLAKGTGNRSLFPHDDGIYNPRDDVLNTKKKGQNVVILTDNPQVDPMEVDETQDQDALQPSSSVSLHSALEFVPSVLDTHHSSIESHSSVSEAHATDSAAILQNLTPNTPTLLETVQLMGSTPLSGSVPEFAVSVPEERSELETETNANTGSTVDFAPDHPPVHNTGSKELSMIVEGDEPEEPVDPALVAVPSGEATQEITVPLRDEPSSNTLKRKHSVTQFSGLPAPSPLRKSMRMSREPSVGQGLLTGPPQARTPGVGLGGKRTSWLTKAQQAKALEGGSGKRAAAVGEGLFGTSASIATVLDSREDDKGKGVEILGLGFVIPRPMSLDAEEEKPKASISADVFGPSAIKGKQKATSLDGDPGQAPTQRSEHQNSLPLTIPISGSQPMLFHSEEDLTVHSTQLASEEDVLDRLKKTVGDLGARVGKGVGKSLGGNAAAALVEMAEARAAAAARVAQRTQQDGEEVVLESQTTSTEAATSSVPIELPTGNEEKSNSQPHKRLSLSELTTSLGPEVQKPTLEDTMKAESKAESNGHKVTVGDASTSTTPPNSPPIIHLPAPPPSIPVFSKPPTVFSLPALSQDRPPASKPVGVPFKLPTTNPFFLPPNKTLNIPAAAPPSSTSFSLGPSALSAQSSKASMFSDVIFDKEGCTPAWMQSTQDTDILSQNNQRKDMDEEDSWHMDDKFQPHQMWTPFGFTSGDKDDTSTWNSLPTASTGQYGEDTGPLMQTENFTGLSEKIVAASLLQSEANEPDDEDTQDRPVVDLGPEHDQVHGDVEIDMDIDDEGESPDLDDVIASGKPTITLVKSKPGHSRSQSQQSTASSSSSQQQLSLFGQASRFVSNILTTSKKGKPEPVKSLALAAAAAKKQQEEAEKKAQRMKDMENRRQLVLQRKAEEEKVRAAEEERKLKEEADRRKREREEHTDKRPLKNPKKADDDTTKKRKLTVEVEKKPEVKKPPPKDSRTSRNVKPSVGNVQGSAVKAGGTVKHVAKQPSITSLAASVQKAPEVKPALKPVASSSNLRPAAAATKGKGRAMDTDDVQPAQLLQSQMAHRAKAQIQAATPRQPPPVTSESIELPDINSEYSDSEDEDRPRTFDPPEWAQSPELRQALEQQSHMNPDDIFGRIGPLRMEEIFRTRQSRFRARTSSANWAGPDQLTAQEEEDYARRMGFK